MYYNLYMPKKLYLKKSRLIPSTEQPVDKHTDDGPLCLDTGTKVLPMAESTWSSDLITRLHFMGKTASLSSTDVFAFLPRHRQPTTDDTATRRP